MTDAPHPDPDRLAGEAIAWLVRVNDPEFADWTTFEAWLSQSPAHADAYHAVAAAEADAVATLSAHVRPAFAEPRQRPRVRRYAPWAGAALAASLVGVVAYNAERPAAAATAYETAPGTPRALVLADGSRVVMNGGSRLVVDAASGRALTLARGEALFTVHHDDAKPFRVRVGDADIVDVGTRFNVVREGAVTRVAVSEGAIDWRRGGDSVRVDVGHDLHARDGSPDVAVGTIATDAVGGWSRGQLDYDGAPLSDVAGDLSRTLGVPVTADSAVAGRTIRGVVQLDGGADAVMPRIAALAGVRAHREAGGWMLRASP